MFSEIITNDYKMQLSGTSEGSQDKYYKDGYWYKENKHGDEAMAEYLSSKLLTYSSLQASEYILYEMGTINGKKGCRSRHFLAEDEELVTFYRLYFNETGEDLSKKYTRYGTAEERIAFTIDEMKRIAGVDVCDYLRKVITLDRIILNEDRHVNNLALIYGGKGFRPAPIFDNGISLLTANRSVSQQMSMEENVRKVIARPFSGDFEKAYSCLGKGFDLNIEEAVKWLLTEEASFEQKVLLHQLEHLEGI
ncbi:MAG: hypothetical protein MJ105_05920 [Lachnospiraceae bacterium]|nr:hypothetical protein [Lachnospiraceae bacterium]